MRPPLLAAWENVDRPVVGMVHLLPLPGAPGFSGSVEAVRDRAFADAAILAEEGVHALLVENFGDRPFYPRRVPAHTVAHMTAIACEMRRRYDLPIGINVLRNDGVAALAVAQAAGAEFIRVNVLAGARVTDQGVLEGIAHELLRLRSLLGATDVKILADVNVKHSAPVGAVALEHEAEDLVRRAGADGLVVSGAGTGAPAELEELRRVRAAAAEAPVLVGSGVTAENVETYAPFCDGFIVGTGLKVDGEPENPVDPERVRALLDRLAVAG